MSKEIKRILTQPMYYVLLSLREQRHGYEIMQYVEWLTKGRVKIGPGTLYSLLSKFEEDEWIKMISDDDNKKIYLIQPLGQEAIEQEIERLELLLSDAVSVKEGNEDEFQNRK
ncbi:MAG: PadR family transcriptional regulator [Clostridium sp.]|nr:PadR family transcriptional regulator [Clostridium sp.]